MTTKHILFLYSLLYAISMHSQEALAELLQRYNTEAVPYITPEVLHQKQEQVILLDARESKEYTVSHIQGAIAVGYDHFTTKTITKQHRIPKDTTIVVYCSLGVRSEDIAIKLQKKGYTNVYNLYGGIFEWKNKHYTVVNQQEKATDSVHTFSKEWSKWLHHGIKINN